jgi:hypothetical protein
MDTGVGNAESELCAGDITAFSVYIGYSIAHKSYSGGQALPDCQAEPDLQ